MCNPGIVFKKHIFKHENHYVWAKILDSKTFPVVNQYSFWRGIWFSSQKPAIPSSRGQKVGKATSEKWVVNLFVQFCVVFKWVFRVSHCRVVIYSIVCIKNTGCLVGFLRFCIFVVGFLEDLGDHFWRICWDVLNCFYYSFGVFSFRFSETFSCFFVVGIFFFGRMCFGSFFSVQHCR